MRIPGGTFPLQCHELRALAQVRLPRYFGVVSPSGGGSAGSNPAGGAFERCVALQGRRTFQASTRDWSAGPLHDAAKRRVLGGNPAGGAFETCVLTMIDT